MGPTRLNLYSPTEETKNSQYPAYSPCHTPLTTCEAGFSSSALDSLVVNTL
jgi:hypothetical protein